MSLINQMLQDLDARRAAHGAGTQLPNDVRPLPPVQASRLPAIFTAVVLVAVVVGAGLYALEMNWLGPLPAAAPSAPVAVAPVEPVQTVQPVAEVPNAPLESTISPEPVRPPAASVDADSSLRIADVIGLPAEVERPKSAETQRTVGDKKQSAGKVAARSDKPKTDDQRAAGPVTPPQVSGKALKPGSIERTDAAGSARERAEAEYRKAIASVNQGRMDEALENLRAALRQDGFHVASRQLLVRLLFEARRQDEVMQVLQEGLVTQPAQIGWAMSLARLQLEKGNLAGAWQTLEYSLPAASGSADYQGFAGHVLQRLGRGKEAVERYQAASRIAPGDGRWWLGLGMAHDAEGHVNEAREALLRAKSTGSLSPELAAVVDQKLR